MKIKMNSAIANPDFAANAGDVVDVPANVANDLIAAGAAVKASVKVERAARGKRGERAVKPESDTPPADDAK